MTSSETMNPYEVLGVSRNATGDEILQARRNLARKYHPDVNSNDRSKEDMMKIINNACDTLCDPDKRQKFDQNGEEGPSSNGANFTHKKPRRDLLRIGPPVFSSTALKESVKNWRAEGARKKYDSQAPSFSTLIESLSNMDSYTNKNRQVYFLFALEDVYKSMHGFFTISDSEEERFGAYVIEMENFRKLVRSNREFDQPSLVKTGNQFSIIDISRADMKILDELLLSLDHRKYMKTDKMILIQTIDELLPKIKVEPQGKPSQSETCQNCNDKYRERKVLFFKEDLIDCSYCCKKLCPKCASPRERKLPMQGYRKAQVCQACYARLNEIEIECWLNAAVARLKEGRINLAMNLLRLLSTLVDENSLESLIQRALALLKTPDYIALFLFNLLQSGLLSSTLHEKYLELLANNLWKMADFSSSISKKHEQYMASIKCFMLLKDQKRVKKELDALTDAFTRNSDEIIKIAKSEERDSKQAQDSIQNIINTSNLRGIFNYMVSKKSEVEKQSIGAYFNKTSEEKQNEYTKWKFVLAKGIFLLWHADTLSDKLFGFYETERAFWNGWPEQKDWAEVHVEVLMEAIRRGVPYPFEMASLEPDLFKYLVPARKDLKFVDKQLWPRFSIRSRNLVPLQAYEKAIFHNYTNKIMEWTMLDSVYSYIDLIAGSESIIEVVFCFLHSTSWALDAMDASKKVAEKYALSRVVFENINQAVALAQNFLDISSKSYVFRFCFGAAYYANRFSVKEDEETLITFLKLNQFYSNVFPVVKMPLVRVCESGLAACELRELSSLYFRKLQALDESELPIKSSLAKYAHFENSKYGVTNDTEEATEAARLSAMDELLEEKGTTWENISSFLDYRLLQRDQEGWLRKPNELVFDKNDGKFLRFDGFSINKKTGQIEIFAEKEPFLKFFQPHKTALFSWQDIANILANVDDMSVCYFSLDPTDDNLHLHPFQKFRYGPECLKGTMMLQTMFHADYLLKQFSMGTEVSSLPPFKQRDVSKETLYKTLPDELIEKLKPINQRGKTLNRCRRLWIQADEVERSIVETEDEIKFLFGNVKMSIRAHPMFHDSHGALIDTPNGPDKNSPEARFAKDLTDNYDEISVHFREFARLKEICKLQYLGMHLNSYKKSLLENERQNLADDHIKSILQRMEPDVRENIESQLNGIGSSLKNAGLGKYSDEFSTVVRELSKKLNAPHDLCNEWLKDYLQYGSSPWSSTRNLVNHILSKQVPSVDEIREKIRQQIQPRRLEFERNLKQLVDLSKTSLSSIHRGTTEWVPALFNKNSNSSFVYGGVTLAAKFKDANLNSSNSSRYPISAQFFGSNPRINPPSASSSSSSGSNGGGFKPPPPSVSSPSNSNSSERLDIRTAVRYMNALKTGFQDHGFNVNLQRQLHLLVQNINAAKKDFQTNPDHELISPEKFKGAREKFDSMRNKLKKEWCAYHNIDYAKYEQTFKGYHLHHVIPLEFGGPNEWWNLVPLPPDVHRKIHASDSPLSSLKSFMRGVISVYSPDYKI